jgi:hypothetical protein
METLDDVNLDGTIAAAKINTDTTEKTYKTYKDKFRKFMKVGKESPFMSEWLTDKIIAAFYVELGVWDKNAPYHRKTGSAAVGSELIRSKLPAIYKQAAQYPDTTIVIKVSIDIVIFTEDHAALRQQGGWLQHGCNGCDAGPVHRHPSRPADPDDRSDGVLDGPAHTGHPPAEGAVHHPHRPGSR